MTIRAGTYRGTADDLTFEFRVEADDDGGVTALSGDVVRNGNADFVATFVCTDPSSGDDGDTVAGPVSFRGNPGLFSGRLTLNADARGVGAFQLVVDLEGGHRDVHAGRLEWQGSFLRRLVVEIDGLSGTRPPRSYRDRRGREMTVERAFLEAGLDVSVTVDSFRGRGNAQQRVRGYTPAEIHVAMTRRRASVPADRLRAHVFVCSYLEGRGNRAVEGIMYDFEESDLNRLPREGVAVFYDHPYLSDPRVPEDYRAREYVFTVVHEIGHALNLLHSFDKGRPAALSWMNYPDLYPRGHDAGADHDGTAEFWRRFEGRFDDEELRHIRHATPREIRAGGFSFGVYEDGASIPFGGTAEPRRTRLGANPLRATRAVELAVSPVKGAYDLGEPVFLRVEVANVGREPVTVPDALDPSEGHLRLLIRTPSGHVVPYRPPVRLCKQAQRYALPPGEAMPPYDGLPLFLSSSGPLFTEPGVYGIVAELTGVDGFRNVTSTVARLRVLPPDAATETFAERLWNRSGALEAMHLRHPLVDQQAWGELEDDVARAPLRPGNTTGSYLNYLSALGWMAPFEVPRGDREKPVDLDKAMDRMAAVDPAGLPTSVRRRKKDLLAKRGDKPEVQKRLAPTDTGRRRAIVSRPSERARVEVPPSGLFGALALDGTGGPPDRPLDPFARIVRDLTGTRAFADVVSWNIEHLHARSNFAKIPRIAELIRDFRCDFWGLQEVDETSLARLAETLNSTGRTKYDFVAVEGRGQQSGALFRTDTVTVEVLDLPRGLFDEEQKVELANGEIDTRPVFHRAPLLCDVRVAQSDDAVFDFRTAVVHLKSTDSKLKDKGASLRKAAAEALVRWIEVDRDEGTQADYLIMGDMNAEKAIEGLKPFAEHAGLDLLSVGMQEKYGEENALTRVASERFLDHIVVTADAVMPAQDLGEQLVVRADARIASWTREFSDHVPVAVRFVLGADRD